MLIKVLKSKYIYLKKAIYVDNFMLKLQYNYIELIIFTKQIDDDLKCMMNSRNIKKIKIIKVMNSKSKARYSHLLLSITF